MRFGVAINSSFVAGESPEARGQQLRQMAVSAAAVGDESDRVPGRALIRVRGCPRRRLTLLGLPRVQLPQC